MSPISRGSTPAAGCYRGTLAVSAIYRGVTLVWAAVEAARIRSSSATSISSGGAIDGKTVNTPAGVTAGDLLVLYTVADTGDITDLAPPAGFTALAQPSAPQSNESRLLVSYKVATGSEPASYTLGRYPTGSDGFAQMLAVTGWDGKTANIGFLQGYSASSATTFTTPNLLPRADRNLLLRSAAHDNSGSTTWSWTPPPGMTTVLQSTNSGGWSSGIIASATHDASTSTGQGTFTVSTTAAAARGAVSTLTIASGQSVTTVETNPDVLFAASYATMPDISALAIYSNGINTDGGRTALVPDPLNANRQVLQVRSDAGVVFGNEHPRTQLETAGLVKSAANGNVNDVYYASISFYLPTDFADLPTGGWLSLFTGAFGSPYGGAGPNTVRLYEPLSGSTKHRLVYGENDWLLTEVEKGKWYTVILGFKFAYQSSGGWVKLWAGQGTTVSPIKIGGVAEIPYSVMKAGTNDGWHTGAHPLPNYSDVSVYGVVPRTILFSHHRLARTFQAALAENVAIVEPPVIGYTTATVDVNPSVRSYASIGIAYNATAANKALPKPPKVAAGDLLLGMAIFDSGTIPTTVVPTGWTEIGRRASSTVRLILMRKVAVAADVTAGSYQLAAAPSGADGCAMTVAVRDWSGTIADLRSAFTATSQAVGSDATTGLKTYTVPTVTPATARSLLMNFVSQNGNNGGKAWSYTPPTGMGAVGYTENAGGWNGGSAATEVYTGTAATNTRVWYVNTTSTAAHCMNAAVTVPAGTVTKTITEFLAEAAASGGTGGALTDTTANSFTDSAGITSTYHLFAAGLDWSKKVGLLVYTDGSNEEGLDPLAISTQDPYVLYGATGLIAVAKKHNMVLLTPRAPGNGCLDGEGVCWYEDSFDGTTPWQKTDWSNELIRWVLTQYNIDRRRIAIGGYSSGAQWTTGWFGPRYASEIMLDGVAIAISYGGPPRATPNVTAGYKSAVEHIWDVGDQDDGAWVQKYYWDGVERGRLWYQQNGFAVTDLVLRPGLGHNRFDVVDGRGVGHFGPIYDEAITNRVIPT